MSTSRLGSFGLWSPELRWGQASSVPKAARLAEDAGFTTLWVPGGFDGDCFAAARQLLEATEHSVIATAIVNIWFHDAASVAKSHETLTKAFPRRFLLGLGVSHAAVVDADQPGRYRRALSAMTSYLDTLDSMDSPLPPDERLLAALGPRMITLAGARSAGAHPYCVSVGHTRQARELLGHGPLLAPVQFVVLETDPDTARGIARAHLAVYAGLPNYTRNWAREGFVEDDFAGGALSDRLVDALVAWGSGEQVAERINAHLEAGADHVAVQLLPWSDAPPVDQWHVLAEALTR